MSHLLDLLDALLAVVLLLFTPTRAALGARRTERPHYVKRPNTLVTGASRGIGAATALTLAKNGVSRFVLHYNSHKPGIDEVLAGVRAEGLVVQALRRVPAAASGEGSSRGSLLLLMAAARLHRKALHGAKQFTAMLAV